MNRDFIAKHWYASVYEQYENQTGDVEFLLNVLKEQTGDIRLNVLEAACGGGRICVPLAEAGHTVTGFDADEYMLLNCYRRTKGLNNLRCYKADAAVSDWGEGFDAVIIAGNFLINIEADMDYEQSQKTIIRKAAQALRKGGLLYLDFDLLFDPAGFFNRIGESSYFEGTDDIGTGGRTVGYGSVFDPVTRICAGSSHLEIKTNNGEEFIISEIWHKHIPAQHQVYEWLSDAGLTIIKTYKNYSGEPLSEPVDESTHRATILARKE